MYKLISAALLTATATATVLLAPAAHAASPACSQAADIINAAIDASGGNLDPATQQSVSDQLLAVPAGGTDKEAINAYVNALKDDNVTNMDPATDVFNRACGFI